MTPSELAAELDTLAKFSHESAVLTEAATSLRRAARVEAFVREWADEACEYGDGCPPFSSRHGRCRVCTASATLEAK